AWARGARVPSMAAPMRCAGPPSVTLIVVVPPVPSGAGSTTVGLTATFVRESFGGGGGGGAVPPPSVPVATLIPGALIVHVYVPFRMPAERQVQSTSVPVPA